MGGTIQGRFRRARWTCGGGWEAEEENPRQRALVEVEKEVVFQAKPEFPLAESSQLGRPGWS